MDKLHHPHAEISCRGICFSWALAVSTSGRAQLLASLGVHRRLCAGSNAIGIYLSIHDPELLERRKQAGPQAETRPAQKIIIFVLIAALVGMLVLSALDHRFGWSEIPAPASLVGHVLAAVGLYITFLVGEFYDVAVSGADAIESRPGFSELLDRIEGNHVRTVIVEDASRFARELMAQELGITLLISRGVRL